MTYDIPNAGGRTDFTRGNLSPNLQARFCKLYPADFVGWNRVIQVILWSPKNGNQGSLYLYTMPAGFFQINRSVKSPLTWRCRKRDRPCLEIPGGDFWTERNTNKSWKLGTHKQVNCKWKIDRIELAKLGLQIWASISLLQNRGSTGIIFPVLER